MLNTNTNLFGFLLSQVGWSGDTATGRREFTSQGRRFLGIDQEEDFLKISIERKLEIENPKVASSYRQKLHGFNDKKEFGLFLLQEPQIEYQTELKL